jgi:hypothetical protein
MTPNRILEFSGQEDGPIFNEVRRRTTAVIHSARKPPVTLADVYVGPFVEARAIQCVKKPRERPATVAFRLRFLTRLSRRYSGRAQPFLGWSEVSARFSLLVTSFTLSTPEFSLGTPMGCVGNAIFRFLRNAARTTKA